MAAFVGPGCKQGGEAGGQGCPTGGDAGATYALHTLLCSSPLH